MAAGERPDDGDARAPRVEAEYLGADDAARDASVAALVDGAVAVDQEVVADVAPVQRLGVVGVDAADHRRRLRAGVAVSAVGVVHERHLDGRVVGRPGSPGFVGAPLRPGHDLRLGRHGRGRGRQVEVRDGGRGAAEDADSHGRAVGVFCAVDGHHVHVAQARWLRPRRSRLLRTHLQVAAGARPDGLREGLLLPAFFGDALEGDGIPAAPGLPVLAGAQKHLHLARRARRRAREAGHGEPHAWVDGGGGARLCLGGTRLADRRLNHGECRGERHRAQLDRRIAHPRRDGIADARRTPDADDASRGRRGWRSPRDARLACGGEVSP